MRQLGIPQQFVGVQTLVVIASLAEHVAVGRKVGTPGERNLGVATIRDVPRGEIVSSLQAVVSTGVGGASIE